MKSWLGRVMKSFQRVKEGDDALPMLDGQKLRRASANKRKAIVVSRPIHLPQDYQMTTDQRYVDDVFQKLRESIFRALDEQVAKNPLGHPSIFREYGMTAAQTPYFYLKPLNEKGWLFERSGSGWVVTRAEKIVGEDLFLRGVAAWDITNLFAVSPSAPTGKDRSRKDTLAGVPRVMSRVLGKELLSVPVYQHKLMRELELFNLSSEDGQ